MICRSKLSYPETGSPYQFPVTGFQSLRTIALLLLKVERFGFLEKDSNQKLKIIYYMFHEVNLIV